MNEFPETSDEAFRQTISRLVIARIAICVCMSVIFVSGVSTAADNSVRSGRLAQISDTKCMDAAQKVLGARAEVLRCGFLNDSGILETVAAIRKARIRDGAVGDFVSHLVVLREERAGWVRVLNVSKHIENPAGYIGIDYIDDTLPFWGYRVRIFGTRTDGEKALVLTLSYMVNEEDINEVPVDVSWDSAVGRYREFSLNSDPSGFQPELANPPHRHH